MGDNSIFTLAENGTRGADGRNPIVTESPESRSLSGINNRQYIFSVLKEYAEELIPDNGLMSPDGWGYFDNSGISIMPGPVFTKFVLSYVKDQDSALNLGSSFNSSRKEGGIIWSLDLEYAERDLSELSDYLTNWNYNLYQSVESNEDLVPAIPEWWSTATDLTDDDGTKEYAWAKTLPSSYQEKGKTYNYFKVATMTKQGIEAYHKTTAVVVGESSYKKFSDAVATFSQATPGTLITPTETFGLVKDNKNFLYEPNGVHPDGDWWIIENRFVHNQVGWDQDIYKAP